MLVLGGLAGALFVPTPYYLLEPGSVRPAEARITVTGADSYEGDDGTVMFTTVYVNQASLATLLRGAIDDVIDVRSEEEVYGDQGRDASRQENQQRMDLSKLVAEKVALEYLGHEVRFTADGSRILGFTEDAPAAEVLQEGDVIVEVDGTEVGLPSDIGGVLRGHVPGEDLEVTVERGKDAERVTEQVELTESAQEPGRPALGVSVDPVNPGLDSEVRVEVDSGDVTGPSAGLAWTLAIIDRLTPGSLTRGRDVAVTGTINADGTIGPIGGIVQKVAAVKRAGVTEFLFPASTPDEEQEQMAEVAGDEVELVPVDDIADAVEVLSPGGVDGHS